MPPLTKEHVARMKPLERRALLDELSAMVATSELALGDAVRVLRSTVLGMDRASFARAVKISVRALANLEDDRAANPRLETLTRVFKPFGATIGLVFPGMHDRAPSEESEFRRAALRGALEKTRRRKRDRDRSS